MLWQAALNILGADDYVTKPFDRVNCWPAPHPFRVKEAEDIMRRPK